MKYIKTFLNESSQLSEIERRFDGDKYKQNPLLIKLNNKLRDVLKNIDDNYNSYIIDETHGNFAAIKILRYKINKDETDFDIIFIIDKAPHMIVSSLFRDANDEIIMFLVKYFKYILQDKFKNNQNADYFDQSCIPEIIDNLDNFEVWMNMEKYNL